MAPDQNNTDFNAPDLGEDFALGAECALPGLIVEPTYIIVGNTPSTREQKKAQATTYVTPHGCSIGAC